MNRLIEDKREIDRVYIVPLDKFENGGTTKHCPRQVTTFEPYEEYGEYSMIPHIAVIKDGTTVMRIPASHCIVYYKEKG